VPLGIDPRRAHSNGIFVMPASGLSRSNQCLT
jgi:hypothetical protein